MTETLSQLPSPGGPLARPSGHTQRWWFVGGGLGVVMKIWALLLLLPVSAFAGQWSLEMPVASYHFDRSVDWNERNPGLGLSYWDKPNTYYSVGCYENSVSRLVFEDEREISCYGARGIEISSGAFRLGIEGGFLTNLPPDGPPRLVSVNDNPGPIILDNEKGTAPTGTRTVTVYEDGEDIAPMVAPYFKFGGERLSLKTYYAPLNNGFVGFQMSWQL